MPPYPTPPTNTHTKFQLSTTSSFDCGLSVSQSLSNRRHKKNECIKEQILRYRYAEEHFFLLGRLVFHHTKVNPMVTSKLCSQDWAPRNTKDDRVFSRRRSCTDLGPTPRDYNYVSRHQLIPSHALMFPADCVPKLSSW